MYIIISIHIHIHIYTYIYIYIIFIYTYIYIYIYIHTHMYMYRLYTKVGALYIVCALGALQEAQKGGNNSGSRLTAREVPKEWNGYD